MASLIVLVGCLVTIITGVVAGPPFQPGGLREKRSVARTSVLSITADDQLVELYVDGVATSFAPGGWGTVRLINIPSNFQVIAVKAVDRLGVASGILASVGCSSNRIVTGSSWKCTTLNVNNWYTKSFNDRSWPAAVIAGTNTASDIHHNLPQIDSTASWIWTRNHQAPTIDPTVYCRGHAVAGPSVLSITADDQLVELYVDGVATSFAPGGWGTVRVINIPSNFKVIAVKAVDLQGVVSGILASVDCNRLVTGLSWKCTTLNINNWYTKSFNDRSWPAAVIAGTNTASDIHRNLPQIDSTAKWIWTSNHQAPTIDHTVYCRGRLG